MAQYFVVYSTDDGSVLWKGQGDVASQVMPENAAILEVTLDILQTNPIDLDKIKTALCRKIDTQAELARYAFITPGSGQALEYQESYSQARQYQTSPAGAFKMLQADVDVGTVDPRTGQPVASLSEAADLIVHMYEAYDAAGSAIKTARLQAKKAIRAGANIKDVVEASAVDWSTVGSVPTP